MANGIVLGEFAINPDCVTNATEISALLRIFGFENGAVISEFPKSWTSEVKSRAQHMEEPARSAFLDKVNKLKEKAFVRLGRNAEGSSWESKALSSHQVRPFSGLLHTQANNDFLCFMDALENDEFPKGFREDKVPRDPDSMVNAVLPLIQASERIGLYDPYFAPDDYFAKFVKRMVERNREVRHSRLYIDIHLEHETEKLGFLGLQQINAFKSWVDSLPKDLTVTVNWWSDSGTGELHPRYLITERGGARFDRGFKIPPVLTQQKHDADVAMMKNDFIKVIENRYKPSYKPMNIIHTQEFKK